MSAKIRLAGKLPGDEPVNGIDPLAEELCDRWLERTPDAPAALLVIGVVKVQDFRTVAGDDGMHRVPTVAFTRLEVLGVLGADPLPHAPVAPSADQRRLLDAAEARTGDTPLPIAAEAGDDEPEILE